MHLTKLLKYVNFVLVFLLIFTNLINPVNIKAEDIKITKDLKITLETYAESLSDLEYTILNPKNIKSQYIFDQNTGSGLKSQEIELGQDIDEGKSNCIINTNGRRKGVCEDGIYTIRIQSTDAAGNRSDIKELQIERDTVKPAIPLVDELYICGYDICMNISGENNAQIYVNNSNISLSSMQKRTFRILRDWNYDTLYKFQIFLKDRAGNKSDIIYKEIKTPILAIGDGDPYDSKIGNDFDDVKMDISLYYPSGDYDISNISIPAPILTSIYTDEDEVVNLFGVSILKKHLGRANVKMIYMTYSQALDYCHTSSIIFYLPGDKRNCVEDAMGIDSIWDWHFETMMECKAAIPIYTNICYENKKKNKRKSSAPQEVVFKVDHVQLSVYYDNGSYLGNIWISDSQGRFTFHKNIGDGIGIGDKVKAITTIYGDFEYNGITLDYRGKDQDDAKKNEGLKSPWSNKLEVPEALTMWDLSVNPMAHCSNYKWTSGFGNRKDPDTGKIKFHYGVDLAKYGGCPIVAVYKGYRTNSWWAGNTVSIDHQNSFVTKFGHGEYYIGENNSQVNIEEEIMYMGKTGYSTGVHLHFALLQNGEFLDPAAYFKFENKTFK